MKMKMILSVVASFSLATYISAATLQSLIPEGAQSGDVITVPNGTYEPSDLSLETRELTFRAETDGGVIIDGGYAKRCADLSDTITLEGFILQNGKADRGGGVRGGTIIRTTVQNCSATFGGGSYKTNARVSIYKGNTAEFFGLAAYGGTSFSCRYEKNASAAYGGGMGALFGVTVANASVTGNTALRDSAGVLLSPAQNMVYYANSAQRGVYPGAPFATADSYASEDENAVAIVNQDIFTNAAQGDYTLNVNVASSHIKDKGDSTLGGNYDALWYDKDFSGRPRFLGLAVDIGPYEIAETFTVTCDVVGVGKVALSKTFIQEGDPVTFTATADETYVRDFDGYYVNGDCLSTEMVWTYTPTKTDIIQARFKGLEATTATLSDVLTQLHPDTREEVYLADGTYTISGLNKDVAFVGTSIGGTIVTLSDDCQASVVVNATVTGTASNITLHRCLVQNFSGTGLTVTSSVLASNCGEMSGTVVNVTAYTTMPAGLTVTDSVTLTATTNTVADAILPKGDTNIDAGEEISGVTPYDNLDIGGRPRKQGSAIDCGAHECHYITMDVEAEGYYTALNPVVGSYDKLTGDVISLLVTSPRNFLGWTLADGTLISTETNFFYTIPSVNVTLKATFQGYSLDSEDSFPNDATAQDTITLAAGTYTQTIDTPATIVGTGTQGDVVLTGAISNATLEAVTLRGATLTNVTLNRCYVDGGTLTNGSVYNSIVVNAGTPTGTFINNTTIGTTLTSLTTNINTRELNATVEDYTPPSEEADKGESMSADQRKALGDLDYYGQPRVNNSTIDKGAVEYQWAPYIVTILVKGHGLVSHTGAVEVVRGTNLIFTVAEDPKHPRGTATVENAEEQGTGTGIYLVAPKADMTVTVTFPGLEVGADATYTDIQSAIAEAQEGETITVAPGTYGPINVKNKRLTIVASSNNPADTIIDAESKTRAVQLVDGAEIVGFTIQNGLSNEGAGVINGTVRRCIIRNNKLTYNGFGAGVFNVFAESCLIVENGSTNVDRSNGGGAANSDLLNCTVANNVAEKGAGLYDCTAKNCVIALNQDLTGATSDWQGDSIEPDPTDCCTPTIGGIAVEGTTLFVDPANSDYRLREGVACIDAATADERLSTLDVAGVERPFGEGVDMGALEWNEPDYQVTISLKGRGQATVSYEVNSETFSETITWGNTATVTVPYGTTQLTLRWEEDTATSVDRALEGIYADGVMIENSTSAETADFVWTLVTRDTVNVDLLFAAADLEIDSAEALPAALTSAIPGEIVRLAEGEYDVAVTVGEGVILDGQSNASLLQGVTLNDGALLKGVTVTGTGVVGPVNGSATMQHCIVTGVTGVAVSRNVVVKTCLVYNNAAGVEDATVYLSTIASNSGEGVTGTTKVYGSILWDNGTNVAETATVVDCYVGGDPRFILPAPDGANYMLMTTSPAIDVAGMANWEGFTEADRALTDLAGNPRPRLEGFDAGAYEVQADAEVGAIWTWYGTDYSMDGSLGGAFWRKMSFGATQSVGINEDVIIADRGGFRSALLTVDDNYSFGNVALQNDAVDLRFNDAGGIWHINSLSNKTAGGALTLNARISVNSGYTQTAGALTIEPNAVLDFNGNLTASNLVTTQTGGSLSVTGNATFNGSSSYTLTDGVVNVTGNLNFHNNAVATIEKGEVNAGRISIAKGSGTALYIKGGNITASRLETGDESAWRYGDVIQTDGTVTLTGSGTGKSAPLHISHWSGASTYTLRGGILKVPNSEVRLGNDGDGTFRLEGGEAQIKSMAIANGRVVLAGGTYRALAGHTLAATLEAGTTTTIIADRFNAAAFYLTPTGTGGIVIPEGSAVSLTTGSTMTSNLELENYTDFNGNVALADDAVLTVPAVTTSSPTIDGTYTPGKIAIRGELPDGEQAWLFSVRDTEFTAEDLTLVGRWAGHCTLDVIQQSNYYNVVATKTSDPEEAEGEDQVVVTVPTITVDGDTTWTDSTKWSTTFVAAGDAVVNATSSGTLHMDGASQIGIKTLTFNVPEGVTLNVTADTMPNATTVKKTGLGTLKWSTLLNYTTFNEGEGTFVAAAAGQGFGGTAHEQMAFRAEANVTLSGQSKINATIADGVTLTINNSCSGSITAEGTATLNVSGQRTFSGAVYVPENASLTISGSITTLSGTTVVDGALIGSSTILLAGDVDLNSISGNFVFTTGLKTLYLNRNPMTLSTSQLMNGQWPAGAMKVGGQRLTLGSGVSSFLGAAKFSGPVTFSNSISVAGALHFASDAVVTIPYGCTLTATDEIRVEPGARFIISNVPTSLDAESVTKNLLVSTKTAGLRIEQLVSVTVVWETAPSNSGISNPIPAFVGDTLQYTVTASSFKTWTGANSEDWSGEGNWNLNGATSYEEGDSVLFPAAATTKTVTLSQSVSPELITLTGSYYTFNGGTNAYAFEGNPNVSQHASTYRTTWNTFFTRGVYTIYKGAEASIGIDDWSYGGSFSGEGNIVITEGRFAL
ncbi:MAG: hypothetical protein IJV69_00825, partial [Kiritimatiellae bacterium]|nr:hypothetical protein [Kiritimatiellia bacterium]